MIVSLIFYMWGTLIWAILGPVILILPVVTVNPAAADALANAASWLAPVLIYLLVLTDVITFIVVLEIAIIAFKGVMLLISFFRKGGGSG